MHWHRSPLPLCVNTLRNGLLYMLVYLVVVALCRGISVLTNTMKASTIKSINFANKVTVIEIVLQTLISTTRQLVYQLKKKHISHIIIHQYQIIVMTIIMIDNIIYYILITSRGKKRQEHIIIYLYKDNQIQLDEINNHNLAYCGEFLNNYQNRKYLMHQWNQ